MCRGHMRSLFSSSQLSAISDQLSAISLGVCEVSVNCAAGPEGPAYRKPGTRVGRSFRACFSFLLSLCTLRIYCGSIVFSSLKDHEWLAGGGRCG